MNTKVLAAALAVAAYVATPGAAYGQSAPPQTNSAFTVPITGTVNGQAFSAGSFTIKKFEQKSGAVYATGTLVFANAGKTVASVVSLPLALQNGSKPAANASSVSVGPQVGAAATCEILDLVLGPLDLDLLGLQIHLDQVVLNIVAESGAGNLLGNLLCAVVNLLNNPLQNLTALVQALNQLLAALNGIF